MIPYQDGRGWAELYASKKVTHSDSLRNWRTARHSYETSNVLHVHDSQWKSQFDVQRPGFLVRSHGKGQYDTGGHNWYMTTRFDVWFTNPHDGYEWHGWLITGGDNSTLRVRRTKNSPLLRPVQFKYRFRSPRITRSTSNCFRISDGNETKWFARQFDDGWRFGLSIGEIFASHMLREAA